MPAKKPKRPSKRNPVAKALRLHKPKTVPKATAYSRKRLDKPRTDES